MNQAIDIPMDDCGLYINVGLDGTWLHFSASSGLHASLSVNVLSETSDFISKALEDWCDDRQKQAKEIREANGQFGVGA